jgi:hypothetical protein
MRPIPASRLGDAHGLLRAISERERLRLDEFVTEYSVEELYPPGLENALGRTRQFVSYARAAGLVDEDRGTVALTEMGKRYVRAGDEARPFDVVPAQAEWLRRLLRERHMTDSIFHGAAVALSLYASNPPDFRPSRMDVGRAISHLGRAGWDSEGTFGSQGERYTTLLTDMGLIDAERRLTDAGRELRDELTLPIHASLKDLAAQLNPGGLEGAIRDGEAEAAPPSPAVMATQAAPAVAAPAAAPVAALAPGAALAPVAALAPAFSRGGPAPAAAAAPASLATRVSARPRPAARISTAPASASSARAALACRTSSALRVGSCHAPCGSITICAAPASAARPTHARRGFEVGMSPMRNTRRGVLSLAKRSTRSSTS